MSYKFAIVGNGFVGKATGMLTSYEFERIIYDLDPNLCNPVGTTLQDVANCDLIFVCVPTPMRTDRSCNTSIVESVVKSIREIKQDAPIVIRSTVPPGFCANIECSFMPEFLTEKNWKNDIVSCPLWVFGTHREDVKNTWVKFIEAAYNDGCVQHKDIYISETTVCELIKYTRNCFLATKVAFFNEIYQLCNRLNIKYTDVCSGVVADPRIGSSHTFIPGPDGKRGFSGTCFPKDMNALRVFIEESGCECHVIQAAIHRNETIDRPEKEWYECDRSYLN